MEGNESDNLAFTYKVKLCTIGRPHSWFHCPFYHPGERPRRRDPKTYRYQPIPCRDYHGPRKMCLWGDACHYSHGFWEAGYHPDRFRTKLCRNGSDCKRVFCSFAHSREQLRPPYRYSITRGPQNNRNPDNFAPSSSAAVAPQAPNSPVMAMPDLFEQWRLGKSP